MLGFNGGLMGVRRVPTDGAATGLWFQNEQSVAKRAELWPITGPGGAPLPTLWYDFADESTVTVESSQITAVASKGSRAWTLTKSATGPSYITGINSLKCLDWGSSQHSNFLTNSDSTTTAIGEAYVVVDGAFGGSFPSFAGLMTGTGGGSWYFLGSTGSSNFQESGTGFDQAFINGGTTNRFGNSSLFNSPSIDSPAIIRVNNSTSATFNATDGFRVGNDRGNANRGWFGLVGEYIIYSSVLSSENRTLVMNYLASKWGITLV
jgi:hypothetical protein